MSRFLNEIDKIFDQLFLALVRLFDSAAFSAFDSPLTILLHVATRITCIIIYLISVFLPYIQHPCLIDQRIFGIFHYPSNRAYTIVPLDFFNLRHFTLIASRFVIDLKSFVFSIFQPAINYCADIHHVQWDSLSLSPIWHPLDTTSSALFTPGARSPYYFFPMASLKSFLITYFIIPAITGRHHNYFYTEKWPRKFQLFTDIQTALQIMSLSQCCINTSNSHSLRLFSIIPYLPPTIINNLYTLLFRLNPFVAYIHNQTASYMVFIPKAFIPSSLESQPSMFHFLLLCHNGMMILSYHLQLI